MNPGLKIKSLYIITGVLLFINIATLGFIWYTTTRAGMNPPGIPPRQDNRGSFLAEELGFKGEQSEKFEILKKEHRTGVENVMNQTRELKDELFDCIKSGDDARAKEIAAKIGDNQRAVELLTYEHFKELRKILDDKQKEKFDRILKELVRGIEVQGPPNRPPEGPPPERR